MKKNTNTNINEKGNEIHLALYRKYRPNTFDDVIGQDIAINILKNSIKENKISHAYIFTGSRGTGKTTTARIFAKEIGCNADDIYELDAASNNSVNNIRDIVEATQSSTFGSKYKIYILDEAHMLSKSAANALLKTLEEPPSHVIFILATTDKEKLPNTIISRCQEINFISPNIETLIKRLKYISENENKIIDEESLKLIAKHGNGSYRDAIGILEKVFNYVNKDNIDINIVKEFFGIIEKDEIIKLLKYICEKDIKNILEIIEKLNLNTNQKLEKFYFDLIKIFELTLLLKVDNNVVKDILCDDYNDYNNEEINTLINISKENPKIISSSNLLKLLELENKISESSLLKETILIVGILNIIENLEN